MGLSIHTEISTIAVYMTSLYLLMLIVRLCVPFNALRGAMLAASTLGMAIAVFFFGWFFELELPTGNTLILYAGRRGL